MASPEAVAVVPLLTETDDSPSHFPILLHNNSRIVRCDLTTFTASEASIYYTGERCQYLAQQLNLISCGVPIHYLAVTKRQVFPPSRFAPKSEIKAPKQQKNGPQRFHLRFTNQLSAAA